MRRMSRRVDGLPLGKKGGATHLWRDQFFEIGHLAGKTLGCALDEAFGGSIGRSKYSDKIKT